MYRATRALHQHVSLPLDQLLDGDEVILIVDDDEHIRAPLRIYLEEHGLAVLEAGSAAEMLRILDSNNVALILLDIGLPDSDGQSLLPEIVGKYHFLSVVMLTGVVDLQVAMACIRKGAEDFLTKPVHFDEILLVVRRVLERRRLIFENLKYQEDLEKAHFRIQLLHQLSLKMNTAYLDSVELDDILRAVLVCTTADEGLRFNRAFLALFDDDGRTLCGRMAIGSHSREQAGRVWSEMQERKLGFLEIVKQLKESTSNGDLMLNEQMKRLRVPASETEHPLIRAVQERKSILVSGDYPENAVPADLVELLGGESFVVVPLYSPRRSLGVIIADNFVTRQPILEEMVNILELFASQASLAIEQSHLYMDMQNTIFELETLTEELEKNKDLLVEAEKYSALGQMSAQLVHSIRNPITSIGGVARLLSKRAVGEEWQKFIDMMIKETSRLELTLTDLFDFVSQTELVREEASLNHLIRKTVLLVQPAMTKQGVEWNLDLPEPGSRVNIDVRKIIQALLHLVKNGVEAMPDGGRLDVSSYEEGGWVNVKIMDTGHGIQDVNIEKATDPFFTTKTYGTGLGLTLVEQHVQAHDGVFTLRRRNQGGTEAIVSLPKIK